MFAILDMERMNSILRPNRSKIQTQTLLFTVYESWNGNLNAS